MADPILPYYMDRDLSWLHFNGRILDEAALESVPLLAKINFLAIFSSNLDEFYRVRMPVLSALKKLRKVADPLIGTIETGIYAQATALIELQQEKYGEIIRTLILPQLSEKGIFLLYNQPFPQEIKREAREYFHTRIAAFLQVKSMAQSSLYIENNKLYSAISFEGDSSIYIVNIPSNSLDRFHVIEKPDSKYIVFIDDILRENIGVLFPGKTVQGFYTFKVTRNADLHLEDEFEGDLRVKIEEQIAKRDYGLATRLLYQPDMPKEIRDSLLSHLGLKKRSAMKGGFNHNLKDFFQFPISNSEWNYSLQPALALGELSEESLFERLEKKDLLVSTPYQSYDPILRFFNEASLDPKTQEIWISIYRVAKNSQILNALISAAKNGKKVTVFVELKARFDEGNNIRWAKKLRKAGVHVLYSLPNLKVHAKIALVQRKTEENEPTYVGLLSTGNLNEVTAGVYADHIILTANPQLLRELRDVFEVLSQRDEQQRKPFEFKHLLVAQFNMLEEFTSLIDKEIEAAKQGDEAKILLKLNNLEDKGLIRKLYEASEAGVKITLIVRSICRLVPGVPGMSSNITVRRLVDRYLEHSRVFVFHQGGKDLMYMGSADWMRRNLYNRIEVCYPVLDPDLKKEIFMFLDFQLRDDEFAVELDQNLHNVPLESLEGVRAQKAIYDYLKSNKTTL
ncbi:polyphosphate kinase 1 [Chryseobacterium sp. A321]